jgi:glycosyltransferase involved in cell wall biosynthesis
MIKVLHVTTTFNGAGGSEGNLVRLICNMDKMRFSNAVVAMSRRFLLPERVKQEGIPCTSLGMRPAVSSSVALVRLLRIVRQVRPHILQTWMYHADLVGLLAGKLMGVPVIAWNIRCSLMDTRPRWSTALVRRALIPLSGIPDVVITNSQSGLQAHQALGYRPRTWIWIPNSIDLDRFRPRAAARAALRAELAVAGDTALIGLVARFNPMKDHANFISAARLLVAENPTVHFVLAGHEMDLSDAKLASLIDSTGARDRFHVLGLRQDIHQVTAGLDVACSSSAYGEGSSNAVAEAMACAVPCVVTDVGDSALIVGDTGKIVPARNSRALAQALSELLALSPRRRLALGHRARERIRERFSLPSVVDRYQRMYESLAAKLTPAADFSQEESFGEFNV